MQTTSPLLAGLFRSLASNARAQDGDPIVSIPPVMSLTLDLPLPMAYPQSITAQIRSSTIIYSNLNFNSGSTTIPLGTFGEGVWRFLVVHNIINNGGIQSGNNIARIFLRRSNQSLTADSTFSEIHGLIAGTTERRFDFPITIDAKDDYQFNFEITAPVASVMQTDVLIIANRMI